MHSSFHGARWMWSRGKIGTTVLHRRPSAELALHQNALYPHSFSFPSLRSFSSSRVASLLVFFSSSRHTNPFCFSSFRPCGGAARLFSSASASPASIPVINYYKRLQISPSATPAEIKTAYRQLALRYHPDVAGHDTPDDASRSAGRTEQSARDGRAVSSSSASPMSKAEAEAAFRSISEAYAVLSDEGQRKQHDAALARASSSTAKRRTTTQSSAENHKKTHSSPSPPSSSSTATTRPQARPMRNPSTTTRTTTSTRSTWTTTRSTSTTFATSVGGGSSFLRRSTHKHFLRKDADSIFLKAFDGKSLEEVVFAARRHAKRMAERHAPRQRPSASHPSRPSPRRSWSEQTPKDGASSSSSRADGYADETVTAEEEQEEEEAKAHKANLAEKKRNAKAKGETDEERDTAEDNGAKKKNPKKTSRNGATHATARSTASASASKDDPFEAEAEKAFFSMSDGIEKEWKSMQYAAERWAARMERAFGRSHRLRSSSVPLFQAGALHEQVAEHVRRAAAAAAAAAVAATHKDTSFAASLVSFLPPPPSARLPFRPFSRMALPKGVTVPEDPVMGEWVMADTLEKEGITATASAAMQATRHKNSARRNPARYTGSAMAVERMKAKRGRYHQRETKERVKEEKESKKKKNNPPTTRLALPPSSSSSSAISIPATTPLSDRVKVTITTKTRRPRHSKAASSGGLPPPPRVPPSSVASHHTEEREVEGEEEEEVEGEDDWEEVPPNSEYRKSKRANLLAAFRKTSFADRIASAENITFDRLSHDSGKDRSTPYNEGQMYSYHRPY